MPPKDVCKSNHQPLSSCYVGHNHRKIVVKCLTTLQTSYLVALPCHSLLLPALCTCACSLSVDAGCAIAALNSTATGCHPFHALGKHMYARDWWTRSTKPTAAIVGCRGRRRRTRRIKHKTWKDKGEPQGPFLFGRDEQLLEGHDASTPAAEGSIIGWKTAPNSSSRPKFLDSGVEDRGRILAKCRGTGQSSIALDPCISLGDDPVPSNFVGFRGLLTLLPHFCQLSVREVGVCGVYSESP